MGPSLGSDPVFAIAVVISFLLTAVFGAALLTYVVRTWQLIRAEGDQSPYAEILDRLDRLQIEVQLLRERTGPGGGANADVDRLGHGGE
jgi:hypothetical protein